MTQHVNPSSAEPNVEGFALSPEQARLCRWQQSGRFANQQAQLRLRLPSGTDPMRLLDSLNRLGERHEILRTVYHQLPGMTLPVQVIKASADLAAQLSTEADGSIILSLPAAHANSQSLLQLACEWAASYEGESSAEPPLQYADYAAWRDDLIQTQPQAEGFWQTQIAAANPIHRLPLRSGFTTADSTVNLGAAELSTSQEQHSQWLALADRLNLSVVSIVLAGWTALLQQHNGAERFTLGLDWQERNPDLGDALGLFSEPLPLTLDDLGQLTFSELCTRVQASCAELTEWRDYFPSGRAGETGNQVGFRVTGSQFLAPLSAAALTNAGWQIELADSPSAPFQLLLEYRTEGTAPKLILHYNQNLYSREAVALLEDQLLTVLANACRQPQSQVSALSPLSDADQERTLGELSCGPRPTAVQAAQYQEIARLPHLAAGFAQQCAKHSEQLAVTAASGSLTYRQLDEKANLVASALKQRGIAAGDRVGHFLPRELDAIVAMLGIFKAGAVYVPVDPSYPDQRIAYILQDSGAQMVVTRQDLVAQLPENWQKAERYLCADDLDRDQPITVAPDINPDQTAYIIYTSGSTGEPKGVAMTHANALHSLAARISYYPEPVRHFLLLSSFAFDSSIAGLFWTLAQGGCLHLASETEQKDPLQLAKRLCQEQISHLLALPSLYQLILSELEDSRCSLSTAIVAGESCPRSLVNGHYEKLSLARLYNEYGPTEASVWSTVAECKPDVVEAPVSIGRPIPFSRVFLLNDQGEPVARGLAGEIYIGGPGLSPGYLNRPELNAEKFVSHLGMRLYRTGDCAHLDEYGQLIFLGRTDSQVKIRGYRIELGEIEAAIGRATNAALVVALAAPGQDGDKQLRAFVESTQAIDLSELHIDLAKQLPGYMLPADIQILTHLPRTANGKVDKKALLDIQPRQLRAPYLPPETELEQALATVWQELLGVEQVGRNDDFFALGGHSLLVVRFIHAVKVALGFDVPVSLVFQNRLLHQLTEQIKKQTAQHNLVMLQAGSSDQAPLFCLHQPSGAVHHYQPLLQALPSSQPLYGIALPEGRSSDDATLAELANEYVERICTLQPEGPYYICGWSMGGLLALAMAHRLEQSGESVAFLAVIDSTFADNNAPLPPAKLMALYRDELTPESLNRLAALPQDDMDRLWAQLDGFGRYEQLKFMLQDWTQHQGLALKAAPEVVQLTLETMRNARRWVRSFEAPGISSRLQGWWTKDTLDENPQLLESWQSQYGSNLCWRIAAGDHDNILQQPEFLGQFAAALAQAQTATKASA